MYPEDQSRNIALLKTRREELIAQIALHEKDRLKFDDLKASLLETQAAIFQVEPSIPMYPRRIE